MRSCPRVARAAFVPLLLAIALIRCGPAPVAADPAIWRIQGRSGETAWLFGTIHAAKRPFEWKTPAVSQALEAADEILVEVADMDQRHLAETFASLSHTAGLPPLLARVTPAERERLAERLSELGLEHEAFADVETWAAALTLARASARDADPEYGIDRAVIEAAGDRPVRELEGADAQLRIFDALPEREQRDLLAAVLAEPGRDDGALADKWARGDMGAIERETKTGLLADPELRAALFVARNRQWVEEIEQRLASGRHPFVAVGAAHLAGPQGLPAMLAARGYRVVRLR